MKFERPQGSKEIYRALKGKYDNLDLSTRAMKAFGTISEESTEEELNLFCKKFRIDLEVCDALLAWQEFMNILDGIHYTQKVEAKEGECHVGEWHKAFAESGEASSYNNRKEWERLEELYPLAKEWATFTGSKLPIHF